MVNQSKEDTMPQRRVLITGASKGIGRAVADRLAAAGHLPIGLARTGPEDFPGEFYEVDLADRAATAEVLDKIVASGRIDAVVNNAGLARFARIGSIDGKLARPSRSLADSCPSPLYAHRSLSASHACSWLWSPARTRLRTWRLASGCRHRPSLRGSVCLPTA